MLMNLDENQQGQLKRIEKHIHRDWLKIGWMEEQKTLKLKKMNGQTLGFKITW